ncbi:MAG: polyphenol oxidase family protein [Acidimicrobiales bacterium]|jgi:YfiH family protein
MPRDVVLRPEQRGSLTVYPADNLRALGVDVFVTDRFNGTSSSPYDSLNLGDHVGDDVGRVRENRALVARAAGVDPNHFVTVRQVHGVGVLEAAEVSAQSEADALVTDSHDLAIAVLVADCVPIALVDTASRRVAVVHAGWRGLRDGVIGRALERLSARDTHVFVGPSISSEKYQVGPEVAQHFVSVEGALLADGPDHSRLDLRLVALRQLVGAGVVDDQVVLSRDVTDGGEVFYSDRAQRPCGRFSIVARWAVA